MHSGQKSQKVSHPIGIRRHLSPKLNYGSPTLLCMFVSSSVGIWGNWQLSLFSTPQLYSLYSAIWIIAYFWSNIRRHFQDLSSPIKIILKASEASYVNAWFLYTVFTGIRARALILFARFEGGSNSSMGSNSRWALIPKSLFWRIVFWNNSACKAGNFRLFHKFHLEGVVRREFCIPKQNHNDQ